MLGCILHGACWKLDPIMQNIILEKIDIDYCCLKQLATLHNSQISPTHTVFLETDFGHLASTKFAENCLEVQKIAMFLHIVHASSQDIKGFQY